MVCKKTIYFIMSIILPLLQVIPRDSLAVWGFSFLFLAISPKNEGVCISKGERDFVDF